ncbi:MAG: hypothetical protein QF819_03830 [Gemmatimonadota bacterium]|jgi:type II secretory pathway pseudopilin PulG|nr:hypothetical protein [Gemmatimonadota bacterium]MDP6462188.1 hypothetical protein [Gemmatimonadota bacterium]MDP6528098.1 hypothetical protein [Gemmatimonadota bacterium]MDP6802292.1 hypothetical protein [Gemmatimonadota bacterium]MDP7031974.1 hypothetical protein [Gemmatimonadota bacterium]
MTEEPVRPKRRFVAYDALVGVLALILLGFLLTTMGIRTRKANLESECQTRLLALSQAQQQYLIINGAFATKLNDLRPLLEKDSEGMSFVCPITDLPFFLAVDGQNYLIAARGTGFKVDTGDPSW